MKPNKLLSCGGGVITTKNFVLSLFVLIVFNSCRKIEYVNSDANVSAKFFELPSNTHPAVKRLAEVIKLKNKEKEFISKWAINDGYPVWDKTTVKVYKLQGRGTESISDTVLLIPLVLQNSYEVQSFIYAKVSDSVLFSLYSGYNYANYGFTNSDTSISANKIAAQIMILNKSVFGFNKFKIKDNRLFNSSHTRPDTINAFAVLPSLAQRTESDLLFGCELVEIWYDPDGDDDPCDCSGNEFIHHLEWQGDDCGTRFSYFDDGANGGGGGSLGWEPIGGGGGPAFFANYLNTQLNLSTEQIDWLMNPSNQEFTFNLYNLLSQDLANEEFQPPFLKAAAELIIEMGRRGLLDNFEENLFKSALAGVLSKHTELIGLIAYTDIIVNYIKVQYALEKIADPTAANTFIGRCTLLYRATEELIHLQLDFAGMTPVIGEIVDLGHAAWYTLQGDFLNASLSAASAIPIAGIVPATARIVKNGRKIIMVKNANNLWHFSRTPTFRKALGLLPGDPRIAHHIIPLGEEAHDVVQAAAYAGFDMNKAINGIPLDAAFHSGNHANYSTRVRAAMTDILTAYGGSITPQQAKPALENLINRIRTAIANHPTVHIDNLIF